jgi:hypothetical protein
MSKEILIEAAQTADVEQDGKNLFIHGLMLSNKPNRNNRVYSEEVLDNAVQHLQEKLKSGSLFGTLGHGSDQNVNPSQIATVMKSLTKTKDGYVGRALSKPALGPQRISGDEYRKQMGLEPRASVLKKTKRLLS